MSSGSTMSQTNHSPGTQNAGVGAQANNYGASSGLMWASAVMASAGLVAGLTALGLVMFRLDDYADQIATEKRLNTQAIDELRIEANVSRRVAGLPVVNSHAHGETP